MEDTANISKSIVYQRPSFYKRVMANLIDFLIFVVIFVFTFVGIRSIVQSTSYYQESESELLRIRTHSGLYIKIAETGYLMDVVTYWNRQDDSMGHKKANLHLAIQQFLSFCESECSEEDALEIRNSYDEYRLDDVFTYNNEPYFVEANGVVKENPECDASAEYYYNNVYAPYIDTYCQGYLITKVPSYYEYTTYQSNMLIYVELLISFPFGAFLTYFIPPLIFKRGRKTIGKLIYKISLINEKDCLNVSTLKVVIRQLIVIIGELILSTVTLCVPILISFSMMAFSKKKQSFPDYMLGIQEIDTTYEKIYYSKEEIYLDELKKSSHKVEFEMEKGNH